MRPFALLISLFVSSFALAQAPKVFQPAASYPIDSAAVIGSLTLQYKAFVKVLPKKTHEKYLEFYKGRHDFVVNAIRKGNFLYSPEMDSYFTNILQEIYRANPEIPSQSIRLFISRNPEPNASSLGDGVLLFNIGLLSRLENESQLAFILCHEIAHYKLNHSEEALRKYIETTESKKTKKELDRISKQEAGVFQKAAELLQAIVYDDRRSSRKHEQEADELGLKYLRNTRYDAWEALRCMEILETIDEEKYPDSLDLRTCFQTKTYPFKEEWLREETLSLSAFGKADEEEEGEMFNSDSLKTHPDCPERLRIMENMLTDYPSNDIPKNQQHEDLLRDLVWRADFETVESFYHFELSGDCLYHALKLLQVHPGDPYLEGKVGIALYMLNHALVNHDLSRQVPLPSPKQEPQYRRFVQFIHKLRSRELARLAYYYMHEKRAMLPENEDVLCALALVAKMMEKPEEFGKYMTQYETAFPAGRYTALLNAP